MRLLIAFTVFAAILHTASALPYGTLFPFFSLNGLPKCARSCSNIREAAINCVPPTAPVSNNSTYIACFCQSRLLHGGNNNSGICSQECNKDDEATIQDTYKALCGFPGPSATMFLFVPGPTTSSTSTPAPAPSTPTVLDTSTPTLKPTLTPTPISTPTVEQPQDHSDHHETRENKNRKVFMAIFIPVAIILAILAWLRYVRHTRTREARTAAYERNLPPEEHMRRCHQIFFNTCQQDNPIWIVDNSLRGRLGRLLKRNRISPAEGQEVIPLQTVNKILREEFGLKLKGNEIVFDRSLKIKNRRARRRNFRTSTSAPLLQPSPPRSAREISASKRPASAHKVASSVGQRSVYSPLHGGPHRPLAPPLPVRLSTPRIPRPSAMPLLTLLKPPPAGSRSATFTRLSSTQRTPYMQRSFSSPLSPAATSVNTIPTPPKMSHGGRSNTKDGARKYEDEITRGSNSPISTWEVTKLRGGQ